MTLRAEEPVLVCRVVGAHLKQFLDGNLHPGRLVDPGRIQRRDLLPGAEPRRTQRLVDEAVELPAVTAGDGAGSFGVGRTF